MRKNIDFPLRAFSGKTGSVLPQENTPIQDKASLVAAA
jgi:hypothetical protein